MFHFLIHSTSWFWSSPNTPSFIIQQRSDSWPNIAQAIGYSLITKLAGAQQARSHETASKPDVKGNGKWKWAVFSDEDSANLEDTDGDALVKKNSGHGGQCTGAGVMYHLTMQLTPTFSSILQHSLTFFLCFLFYFAKSISNHLLQHSGSLLFLLLLCPLRGYWFCSVVFHALVILPQCCLITFCCPYHFIIASVFCPHS